jgi:hypothetical protein
VIKGQWLGARLRRQVASLEEDRASLERRVRDFEAATARNTPVPAEPEEAKPYVGLKSLIMGYEEKKQG